MTFKVAQALRQQGIDVAVIAAEPSADAPPGVTQDNVRGVSVFRLEGVAITDPFVSVTNALGDTLLRDALRRFSPDIIHAFHFNHIGVGAIDVAADLGIPLLFTATDFWWNCPLERLQGPDDKPCPGPGLLGSRCLRHRLMIGMDGHRSVRKLASIIPSAAYALPLAAARASASFVSPARRSAHLSLRQEILRRYAQRIHHALAPTEAVLDAMLSAGFAPDRLSLLPFGINPPQTSHLPNTQGPVTIGFIGTLREHKGAHLLLEAVAKMQEKDGVQVRIYGDPTTDRDYAERLAGLAQHASVPVSFEGSFAEEIIGDVLQQLDIVVIPSLWMENRPLVLLSALLMHKPVIVTDQPGLTCEVVDGENGLVVPPLDAAALGRAISRLVQDEALREKLAGHPRRPVTMDAYIEAISAIYRGIVFPGTKA